MNARQYDGAARATGVTAFSDAASASEHLGIPAAIALRCIDQLRQSL